MRMANGYRALVEEISNRETVGKFSLKRESGSQIFGITPTKGRYFKVLITESYSGTNSALAEVYAYGLK